MAKHTHGSSHNSGHARDGKRGKGKGEGTRPTDQELATWINQALIAADGFDDDEWSANMQRAFDYYTLRPRGDEVDGKSAAQSADVADMVEAVLSQMIPSFAGDSVVTFEALSEQDEQQAQMESDVVSQVIMEDNRGFYVFLESLKDALMLKNGIIKIEVEETVTRRTELFENLSEIEMLEAIQPDDDTVAKLLESSANDDGTFNARINFTRTRERLIVRAVPPENFFIEQGFDSIFVQGANFVGERFQNTRSELLEKGFPKSVVMQLQTTTQTDESATMRNLRQVQPTATSNQRAQENIEWYETYYQVDMTGDGVTELIKASISGVSASTMLQWEFVDFIPYAAGSPFINPHRFLGYSIYDKEASVQDIKTAALRQWLDNAGNNNVNRATVVEGQVNMADAKDNRSSGLIRQKAPGMYQPVPINDIGPSMLGLLTYMDQVRAERGGASLELQSGELQLASSIGSQGLDRAYSTKEQLAGLMTRTLAETLIRTTYLLVHQTIRSQMTAKFQFKRAGQWVETDPSTWPERNRVNIKIGLSPNERQRKSQNLQQVMQTQQQLMQQGGDGILVDVGKVHNALIDWARSADVDAPQQYWIDPASPEAQQAMQQRQEQQQQQQQQQAAQQEQVLQLSTQLEAAKIASDDWQTLLKTQYDYFNAVLDSQTEEAKLLGGAVINQLDAMQNAGLRQTEKLGAQADNGGGSGSAAGDAATPIL